MTTNQINVKLYTKIRKTLIFGWHHLSSSWIGLNSSDFTLQISRASEQWAMKPDIRPMRNRAVGHCSFFVPSPDSSATPASFCTVVILQDLMQRKLQIHLQSCTWICKPCIIASRADPMPDGRINSFIINLKKFLDIIYIKDLY